MALETVLEPLQSSNPETVVSINGESQAVTVVVTTRAVIAND